MIIYNVDPTNRTTFSDEREIHQKQGETSRERDDVQARRATEYKMKIKYPFTVVSAPLVLALPFVVLYTHNT